MIRFESERGREELSDDLALALKALAIGYEKIDRLDGLQLMLRGLANRVGSKWKITPAGWSAIIWEKHDVGDIY